MARRAFSPKRNRTRDSRHRISRNPHIHKVRRPFRQEPEDQDRFYVVEKILDRRQHQQTGQYEVLVRWQNYAPEYDTWEPEEEIRKNCESLVTDFIIGSNAPGPADNRLHCICLKQYHYKNGGMVWCMNCSTWYHFTCINMDMEQANAYLKWYCKDCLIKNHSLKCAVKPEKLNTFYGAELDRMIKEERERLLKLSHTNER